MAITLDFYGGLFLEHQDAKIDVHLWKPKPVVVQLDGESDVALGRLLTAAAQLTFEGSPPEDRNELPIRPLSNIIPINYDSAAKTIRFQGGDIDGSGPPVTDRALKLFLETRKVEDREGQLQAFRQLSGISGRSGPVLQTLAEEFFAQPQEDLKYWVLGYHVTVELDDARVVPSGQAGSSYPLPDGARIIFDVEENSVIPHEPLNNPHVLERPPSRRRGRRQKKRR